MDGEQWKHLAMIAHHCYGSFDLALRAVMVAAQSGAIDAGAFERYLQYLRAPVAREERA
jgi:hypothetical protein